MVSSHISHSYHLVPLSTFGCGCSPRFVPGVSCHRDLPNVIVSGPSKPNVSRLESEASQLYDVPVYFKAYTELLGPQGCVSGSKPGCKQ